jgi:hypothetical protein
MGLPSLLCSLAVARLAIFNNPNVDEVQTEDFQDFLKSKVHEALPQTVLNLNSGHLVVQLEAWILSLRRLSQSLSFERHLETVFVCQRVNILSSTLNSNLTLVKKFSVKLTFYS